VLRRATEGVLRWQLKRVQVYLSVIQYAAGTELTLTCLQESSQPLASVPPPPPPLLLLVPEASISHRPEAFDLLGGCGLSSVDRYSSVPSRNGSFGKLYGGPLDGRYWEDGRVYMAMGKKEGTAGQEVAWPGVYSYLHIR
jgi:hypothetical protein